MISLHRPNPTSHDRPKATNMKNSNNSDKPTYKCNHFNQTGHSKSRCFELIGYPDWWDLTQHRNSKRLSTAAVVQTEEDDATPTSLALVTTTNTTCKAFTTSTPVLNSTWIIYSGTTDHMTFDVR